MTTPIGKYKLLRLIASGGMAEGYLARQAGAAGFEKLVCLKRILPHLARDRQFVEMFLNEARLAARLDHPNIVSIYDLGEANGNYFIAMEFIDGPSLRAVAKRARAGRTASDRRGREDRLHGGGGAALCARTRRRRRQTAGARAPRDLAPQHPRPPRRGG